MILGLLIVFLVFFVVELYAYHALKTVVKSRPFLVSYLIMSGMVLVFIIYSFAQFDRAVGQTGQSMRATGLILLIYIPKIILTLVLLGEDISELVLDQQSILLITMILLIFFPQDESLSVR